MHRSSIVSETAPGANDIASLRFCERSRVREAPQKSWQEHRNAVGLRLLQHDFGDENNVLITRRAPKKCSPRSTVPTEKIAARASDSRVGVFQGYPTHSAIGQIIPTRAL
jgi:hypothetical protein